MGKVMDAIERLVFGATAEERVAMLVELAARRAEHRIVVALTEGEAPEDEAPAAPAPPARQSE